MKSPPGFHSSDIAAYLNYQDPGIHNKPETSLTVKMSPGSQQQPESPEVHEILGYLQDRKYTSKRIDEEIPQQWRALEKYISVILDIC